MFLEYRFSWSQAKYTRGFAFFQINIFTTTKTKKTGTKGAKMSLPLLTKTRGLILGVEALPPPWDMRDTQTRGVRSTSS